jgi:hypothetical protein
MSVKVYTTNAAYAQLPYGAFVVEVSDYDAIAAANADLQLHFDTLKADRDQQYDMKVKAREQRDAVTADNQRLREALTTAKYRIEQGRVWNGMGWTLTGLHSHGQQQALDAIDTALTNANGEVEV